MSRFVYLIDADANLDQHLADELARVGFRVETAVDSNEVMQRKDDLPSLIVLCIDPKRTGWAVCNRLRKSTTLKATPLIITSAEATEKDFEDHKKLKTRAEEYLHKPFSAEALVDKIAGLIGMPEGVAHDDGSLEIPMESEEIAVEDDGSIIEDAEAEPLYGSGNGSGGFAADEEDRTRIGVMNIDGEVDMETDAAFAAIGMEPREESQPAIEAPPKPVLARVQPVKRAVPAPQVIETRSPSSSEIPLDEHVGGEDDPFSLPAESSHTPMPAPLPPADSMPIPVTPVPIMRKETSEPIDLGLDAVAQQASKDSPRQRVPSQPKIITSAPSASTMVGQSPLVSPAVTQPMSGPADTAAHDTQTAALAELKRERDQLRRDVEELQKKVAAKPAEAAPATSGFSREREFLNLREIINKKEKEVLDLRDALDGKERAILDGKDKLRELERKVRDLDEKALTMERDLVAAREKVEALGHDKEKAVEREKQVKSRLDDALKSNARYEEEIEGWKQKHAADVGTAEQNYNNAVAGHQQELQALKAQQAAELEQKDQEHGERLRKTVDSHEEDKALIAAKHDEERGRLEAEHAEAMRRLRESADNEREGLRLRHEQQLGDAKNAHASELHQLRSDHASTLAQMKSEFDASSQEKDQLHTDEMAGLRARHTKDNKESERRHQEELGGLHAEYKQRLADADAQRLAELAQKDEEHRGELEALAAQHDDDKLRVDQEHAAALGALDERRQNELREAAAAHAQELTRVQKELEQKIADEIKSARDSHLRKVQALEESHADLKMGMQQRHAAQLEELQKQHAATIGEFEAALAERDRIITEGHAKIGELETALDDAKQATAKHNTRSVDLEALLKTTQSDLEARNSLLNERAQRISELENESAGYQDQILKAYQRIKSDESIVSRAKKALAIALTLLDESAPDDKDEASS
jgi:CheY-like chemotaxis protein